MTENFFQHLLIGGRQVEATSDEWDVAHDYACEALSSLGFTADDEVSDEIQSAVMFGFIYAKRQNDIFPLGIVNREGVWSTFDD